MPEDARRVDVSYLSDSISEGRRMGRTSGSHRRPGETCTETMPPSAPGDQAMAGAGVVGVVLERIADRLGNPNALNEYPPFALLGAGAPLGPVLRTIINSYMDGYDAPLCDRGPYRRVEPRPSPLPALYTRKQTSPVIGGLGHGPINWCCERQCPLYPA